MKNFRQQMWLFRVTRDEHYKRFGHDHEHLENIAQTLSPYSS